MDDETKELIREGLVLYKRHVEAVEAYSPSLQRESYLDLDARNCYRNALIVSPDRFRDAQDLWAAFQDVVMQTLSIIRQDVSDR